MARIDHSTFEFHKLPLTDTKEDIAAIPQRYARFVIGLGFPKCGSTYFLQRLSTESERRSLPPLIGRQYHDELHYWDFCFSHGLLQSIDKHLTHAFEHLAMSEAKRDTVYPHKSHLTCSFQDYIREWRKFDGDKNPLWNLPNSNTVNGSAIANVNEGAVVGDMNSGKYWMSEKSPSYILNPHVASLFNAYLNQYPSVFKSGNLLKFYVLLRNPVSKLWSNFYRRCRTHWHSKEMRSAKQRAIVAKDCNKAVPKVVSLFLRNYKRQYASDFIGTIDAPMRSSSKTMSDAQFRTQLATTYIDFSYRNGLTYQNGMTSMTVFIAGCYILPILAYEYVFETLHTNGAYFADNFRIVRSEDIFDESKKDAIIDDALCWIYFDSDKEECARRFSNAKSRDKSRRRRLQKMHEALSEVPSNLKPKLRHFYEACNSRLYEFAAHSEHLFFGANKQFTHWW